MLIDGKPALLGLILCVALQARASQTSLSGHVVDDGGRGLPGVSVEARSGARSDRTTTGPDGTFRLAGLASGTYQVTFRLPNFASSVRRAIVVEQGRGVTLEQTLRLAANADVVVTGRRTFTNLADITDSADLVGVADSATEGVVTPRQLEERPILRTGELLETVPGLATSQHSGEGKANQYYLRGFNLDHGTDLATFVAGIPVNMPTHGHGQGYSDIAFLIPELVSGIQYRKGPYFAEEGNFSAAGAVHVNLANVLEQGVARLEAGGNGFRRGVFAVSPKAFGGTLLLAGEGFHNDGPWERKDDYRRFNGLARFSKESGASAFSFTLQGYDGRWNATDQVPGRAIESGLIGRFGTLDGSNGGTSSRYSASFDWQRSGDSTLTRVSAYGLSYDLNLFSNFTYFLDDPVNGDQFEQEDKRVVTGVKASHRMLFEVFGKPFDLTLGLDTRNDNIAAVGLYRTRQRERLETVRADRVVQTSGALYAQGAVALTDKLRATLGFRADAFRFRVTSLSNAANSGRDTDALVSPKAGLVLGPFAKTEIYLNGGYGYHSNDARGTTITVDPTSGEPVSRVDPLVRARGAELGVRTTAIPGVQITAALWGLSLDSELLFVGDAGTTEASRPSRRQGVEIATYWAPVRGLTLDADLAFSGARFTDDDPAGDRIPGAVERVISAGATYDDPSGLFGGLRVRHIGPRALVQGEPVRTRSSPVSNVQARPPVSLPEPRFCSAWKPT